MKPHYLFVKLMSKITGSQKPIFEYLKKRGAKIGGAVTFIQTYQPESLS